MNVQEKVFNFVKDNPFYSLQKIVERTKLKSDDVIDALDNLEKCGAIMSDVRNSRILYTTSKIKELKEEVAEKPKAEKKRNAVDDVMDVFKANPEKIFDYASMQKEMPEPTNEKQLRSALYKLTSDNKIVKVARGNYQLNNKSDENVAVMPAPKTQPVEPTKAQPQEKDNSFSIGHFNDGSVHISYGADKIVLDKRCVQEMFEFLKPTFNKQERV